MIFRFCLLKRIVNSYGESWMGLFCHVVHGMSHTIKKKGFGLIFASMTRRRCNQFF